MAEVDSSCMTQSDTKFRNASQLVSVVFVSRKVNLFHAVSALQKFFSTSFWHVSEKEGFLRSHEVT